MSYIDYINQFWEIQQTEDFSPNEVFLYFFLLKECNLRRWPNKFEYSNRRIVLATGMSEKTVIACRNRLQQKGLIIFEAGKRNAKSPVYYFPNYSKEVSKEVSNRVSKEVSKEVSNRVSLNKDIRYKTKEYNNSSELFPEKPKKKKTSSKPKAEFIPPSLSEIRSYFSGKLPDWEIQAETFYNHFTSLGWRTASGAKVERWDSRANLWITEKITNANERQPSTNTRRNPITIPVGATRTDGDKDKPEASSLTDWINSIPIG